LPPLLLVVSSSNFGLLSKLCTPRTAENKDNNECALSLEKHIRIFTMLIWPSKNNSSYHKDKTPSPLFLHIVWYS
jgi:hypothetical protein